MKLTTLSPIIHDGKRIQLGAALDVPKAEAEELIAAGAAEPYNAKKAKEIVDANAGESGGTVNEPLDPNDPPIAPVTESGAA